MNLIIWWSGRNRTIYKRMREYLYELKHDPSFVTSILPLGDGVTVSVKTGVIRL